MSLFAQDGLISGMFQFFSELFDAYRFWPMILYVNLIVMLGVVLFSFVRSVGMIVFGNGLRWADPTPMPMTDDVDIHLLISCMSLTVYVLPIVIVDKITYALWVIIVTFAMEMAIYRQLENLLVVRSSPNTLVLHYIVEEDSPFFDNPFADQDDVDNNIPPADHQPDR